MVLLKLYLMWATPITSSFFFLDLRALPRLSLAIATLDLPSYFFLPPGRVRGPFRVRALFFVFWPRAGSFRRCLRPR